MDLDQNAVAAIAVRAMQLCGICLSALYRADALQDRERLAAIDALGEIADLLDAFSGDDLPVGLAAELQARATALQSQQKL